MWASRSGRDGRGGTATGDAPDGAERLERSRHKVVAGVCGGLGRYFDVDPVLFRVPLAVLSVMGGLGLLFYAFAWLLVPLEGDDENEAKRLLSGRVDGGALSAVLLALAGCGVALASLGNGKLLSFAVMVIAALGAAAYWSQKTRGQEPESAAEARPEAPPEPKAPPAPTAPSWWREPTQSEGYLWGPEGAGAGPAGERAVPAGGGAGGTRSVPAPAREQCRGLSLGGGVFLAAMAAAVVSSAAVWSSRPLGSVLVVGLSCALAVFGVGLVIGAFVGRIGGGTIVGVVLTAVLVAGAAALPQDLTTTYSERVWQPGTAAEVQDRYRIGTGTGTLDLGGLRLSEGDTVRTSVRVAAGEARVVVPSDALVEVELRLGVGGYDLPGTRSDRDRTGINGGGFRLTENYTMGPAGGEEPTGTVELTVDVGAGAITLERDDTSADRDGGSAGDTGRRVAEDLKEERP